MRVVMKNIRALLLSLLICFWSVLNYPAVLIFDLEGVLIKKSGFSVAWNIGFRHFLGLYNPYKVRRKMFEFFNTIEARKPDTPWAYNHDLLLPQLLCDWLMGLKTNKAILEIVQKALKEKKNFFSKKKYYKLTKQIADFMFTPERLANAMRPITKSVDLLQQCKQKNHKIYILSNWDAESFKQLCKKKWFKEILDLCDGWIISGIVHMMKPDPMIYELLFETYDLDPNTTQTIYIDDSRENILAARTLQKKELVCFEYNTKKLDTMRDELLRLKIL